MSWLRLKKFSKLFRESGDVLKELGTGDFFGEIGILNLSGGQNRSENSAVKFTPFKPLIHQ